MYNEAYLQWDRMNPRNAVSWDDLPGPDELDEAEDGGSDNDE